jgi:hypothetical protein
MAQRCTSKAAWCVDPLNSNKRQPQLNEFALAQRVADGFNDIPASVSLARPLPFF